MTGRQIIVRGAQFLEAHKQPFGDASDRMPTNPSPIRTALCCQAVAVRIGRPSLIIHRSSRSSPGMSSPSPNALNLKALEAIFHAAEHYERSGHV